jgi:hypothetical protein
VSSGISETKQEESSQEEFHKRSWNNMNGVTRSYFEEVLDGDDREEASGRSRRELTRDFSRLVS